MFWNNTEYRDEQIYYEWPKKKKTNSSISIYEKPICMCYENIIYSRTSVARTWRDRLNVFELSEIQVS